MKVLTVEYFEGSPDLVKYGGTPFFISLWLDEPELPSDSSFSDDGQALWREYLDQHGIHPDSIQPLGASFSHKAHFGWHDRADALNAFRQVKQYPQEYPSGTGRLSHGVPHTFLYDLPL